MIEKQAEHKKNTATPSENDMRDKRADEDVGWTE